MFSNIAIKLRALQEMFSKIADTLLGHHGCTRRQGCKHSSMASADSLRKSFTYRRWTPWALPLRTCQEKFSMHTRFCPQAQPTRACCEGLALRAISLRTSLLSGCAALNSKNTSSSIWRFSSDSRFQVSDFIF